MSACPAVFAGFINSGGRGPGWEGAWAWLSVKDPPTGAAQSAKFGGRIVQSVCRRDAKYAACPAFGQRRNFVTSLVLRILRIDKLIVI